MSCLKLENNQFNGYIFFWENLMDIFYSGEICKIEVFFWVV